MAWHPGVGGMNVNRLDKAGESNQQNAQQRESRNANVPARSVGLRRQIKNSGFRIDYYTAREI
jgi:hypothetical protein